MPDIRPLSDELQGKAVSELNEVPTRIQSDIDTFRDWIKKSPHLIGRTDDQFLLFFLRGCKFSLEKAKQKYDLYYTIRSHLPEIIGKRDPADNRVLEILRLGAIVPILNTENSISPRITIIRPGVYDPEKYKVQDVVRVNTMIQDLLAKEDDQYIICGTIGILDLSNVTVSHIIQMQPMIIKKMNLLMQDSMPVRQKGFHIVNAPNGFMSVLNIFKSFMTEKNKSRINIHGSDFESLFKKVPKHLMPSEYGGDSGTIESILSHWEKRLTANRDFFLEDANYKTDEKKRQGNSKSAESLFGLEGSFRKLEID